MYREISLFLKKMKNWCVVMFTTTTKEGPPLFFQFAYFFLNTATILERIHRPAGQRYRAYLQRVFDREIIIRNQLGLFSVNPKNDSLTKSITSFEYGHQQWLTQTPHREVFLDIGANIGFYSLLALKRYDYKYVHAFEPNPETFARLQKNVELNELTDRVKLHAVALSDTSDHAILTAKKVHTGGSSLLGSNAASNDIEKVKVTTDTFDTIAYKSDLLPNSISFIKIDVEGYEFRVLNGMIETLSHLQKDTCIFIEIHPSADHAIDTKRLIETAQFKLIASSPQKNFLYRKEG